MDMQKFSPAFIKALNALANVDEMDDIDDINDWDDDNISAVNDR